MTTLHYTLHFSPLTVIDVGAKGNSLGDEIVSHDIIFSTAGKRVGYDAQTCMITSLRPPHLGCSLVFALPGGTITGQYIGAPPPHKLAAYHRRHREVRRREGNDHGRRERPRHQQQEHSHFHPYRVNHTRPVPKAT